MAGLIDFFNGKWEADKAQHQADMATSKARIKNLENLQRISSMIAEQAGQGEPNASGGTTLGPPLNNNLLNELMAAQTQIGELGPLLNMGIEQYKTDTDPKRQIFKQIFGGGSPVNLAPGATPGPAGNASTTPSAPSVPGTNPIADIMEKARLGNPEAMSQLAALKMAGMDVGNLIADMQSANKAYPRTITAKDGTQITAMFNSQTHEMIPGTAQQSGKVEWRTIKLPDGSEYDIPVLGAAPLGGTAAGGSPGMTGGAPGLPKALPEIDLPIKTEDIPLWRNPDSLSSPPAGMTPKEAQKLGYKRVSTNQATKADSLKAAMATLSQVEALVDKVFPKTEGATLGRAEGALKRKGGAIAQTNENAAIFESLVGGTLSQNVRAMGDVGALSEGDVQRAKNLNPKLTDRADIARGKVQALKKLFSQNQKQLLGGGLGGDIKRIPGESAADYLRRKRTGQ